MKKMFAIITGIMGAIIMVLGIFAKVKGTLAISIIGSADGPTIVFLAGKVGDGFSTGLMITGIMIAGFSVLFFIRNRK